jgi:nitrite reductase/ring-hydroxylating ferredoxin subunit
MPENWVPVALSQRMRKGGVMRCFVRGAELAIWRSASGKIHAWDNRCPHRGMRLSHGFVRGEQLACLYHGWHYGADGTCAYIPAHPELTPPATICVTSHSCTEAGGIVWVGGDAKIPPRVGRNEVTAVRTIHLDCRPSIVEETIARMAGSLSGISIDGSGIIEIPAGDGLPCTVFVAIQDNGPIGTAAHVTASRDATQDELCAVSRIAEDFRRRVEAISEAVA